MKGPVQHSTFLGYNLRFLHTALTKKERKEKRLNFLAVVRVLTFSHKCDFLSEIMESGCELATQ